MTHKPAIVITIKNVYGTEKVYPVCEAAKTFANIAGTRTLTMDTIDNAKRLGFEVIIEQQSDLAQRLGAA